MADKTITLLSFSFKKGLPTEADTVIDARFLRNPFYEPSLKNLSGKDKAAGDFIETDPDFSAFFKHLTALMLPLLPRYLEEDKPHCTLAVGCTGGRHRSVYVIEKLAGFLRNKGYSVQVTHRDLK